MFRTLLVLFALLAGVTPLCSAHPGHDEDEPPEAMERPGAAKGLGSAFESAWTRSLESIQSAGRQRAAEAQRDAAGSYLAGGLAMELDHLRSGPSRRARESEAALILPLFGPGRRDARLTLGASEIRWSEAALLESRWRLGGEVREAAWLVVAASAEAEAAGHNETGARQLADDVDRRVRAGDLAPVESLAARAEWLAAQSARLESNRSLQEAVSRWSLLTGQPAPADAAESDRTPAGGQHPSIVLARAARERAQAQLEEAISARQGPFEVRLRATSERSGPDLPSQPGVGLGVRIPLGSSPADRPREAEALAALETARVAERRAQAQVEALLVDANGGAQSASERLASSQSRLALLRERQDLLVRSFTAGETALPDLLRARAAFSQVQVQHSRLRAELGLAQARRLQALGILP